MSSKQNSEADECRGASGAEAGVPGTDLRLRSPGGTPSNGRPLAVCAYSSTWQWFLGCCPRTPWTRSSHREWKICNRGAQGSPQGLGWGLGRGAFLGWLVRDN